MMVLPYILTFIAGLVLGGFVVFFFKKQNSQTAQDLVTQVYQKSEEERQKHIELTLEKLKSSFGELSAEKLSQSMEELQKLSQNTFASQKELHSKELDGKKQLIDQQLKNMHDKLENVGTVLQELEKDREKKYLELTNHLKTTNQQTSQLIEKTHTLNEVLSNSRLRGQWGERMADDVLRVAGFVEKVNYLKQKSIESSGSRPDFTFLLPKDLKLNMDVKFPMDNYVRYLESESDLEKAKYRADFFKDIKAKIKEVTTRDYINPEQNTVDYVLLFIPNEQIYSFIHEHDHDLLDTSLKKHVVFCSPVTLFAVLAVIRQAVDNFALEKTSHQILSLFSQFKKQWEEYLKKFDNLGKRLQDAQKEFDLLTTTRKRKLEIPLNKIEELREQKGISSSTQDLLEGEIEPEKEIA